MSIPEVFFSHANSFHSHICQFLLVVQVLCVLHTRTTSLAQSDTWGCGCHKPNGRQTDTRGSPGVLTAHHRCSLALCTHSLQAQGVRGSCPSRLQERRVLKGAREGTHMPPATCDLLQAFARGTTLLLGKLCRCPRGWRGPQRRVSWAGSTAASPTPPARPSASR